jgi:putative ABC transport system permease protein
MTAQRPRSEKSTTPSWRRYLRFWRADLDRDTDEELRLHLELRVEELVAEGMTVEAARERAASEFGDLRETRERLREIDKRLTQRQRRGERLGSVRDDVRYTFRSLRRTPAFFVAVLVTMTLGLGVNASMFSFLDDVFFRPPAGVAQPGSLRRLWSEFNRGTGAETFWGENITYPDHQTIAAALAGDGAVALYIVDEQRVGHGGDAPMAHVAYVSTNYFSVLGATLARGRTFVDDENQFGRGEPVVVISEAFRDRQFGTHADAIGEKVRLGGKSYTIIGVGASGFTGPDLDAVDVWFPLAVAEDRGPRGEPWWQSHSVYAARQIVRLRPSVDERALSVHLTTMLQAAHRAANLRDTAMVVTTGPINAARGPGTRDSNVIVATRLAGVALIVLFMACANVVNLLLVRAFERRREIAIRMALGVSRARLIRLMLTESLMLALFAGASALLATFWGGALLRHLLLPTTRWGQSPLGTRLLALSIAAAIVAGLAVGFIPALQSSKTDVTSALKSGGHDGSAHRSRLRASLVGVQAAFAVVLLVVAVLFVTSLRNVRDLDIGYDAERLVFASVAFDEGGRPPSAVLGAAYRQVSIELAHAAGIESVALAGAAPMRGFSTMRFYIGADSIASLFPDRRVFPTFAEVSPSYFHTVGLRFLEGSGFSSPSGGRAPNSVVVNRVMAKTAWRGVNPIGQCIRFESRMSPCYLVTGIVEDGRFDHVIESVPHPQFYLPLDNMPVKEGWGEPGTVIIRADPRTISGVMADASARLRRLFPNGSPKVKRMVEYLEPEYRPYRLGATLFTAFGILALMVAVVGIYSTVSYAVRQRTHEFGVRIALGAQLRDVVTLVVGRELRVIGAGVIAGIGLALATGRFISSLLYGVAPSDPRTIAIVTAVLIAAGVAASLGPAWRAGRADPASVLRDD